MVELSVRLLALGLMLHELLYFASRGTAYFRDCVAPVLGLRLAPRAQVRAHAALIAICAAILLDPSAAWLYTLLLVPLSVVIASFSVRLSNHLVLAWFLAAFAAVDVALDGFHGHPGVLYADGARALVIGVYMLAFFSKLNPDYLDRERSCGAFFVHIQLLSKGVHSARLHRTLALTGIYPILVAEGAVVVALLFDSTLAAGVLLALVLQVAFGLLCHAHFATVMTAGIAAFAPGATLDPPAAAAAAGIAIAGALLGAAGGNVSAYAGRATARAAYALFGAVAALLAVALVDASGEPGGLARAGLP